jgi:hypothetical protein
MTVELFAQDVRAGGELGRAHVWRTKTGQFHQTGNKLGKGAHLGVVVPTRGRQT